MSWLVHGCNNHRYFLRLSKQIKRQRLAHSRYFMTAVLQRTGWHSSKFWQPVAKGSVCILSRLVI